MTSTREFLDCATGPSKFPWFIFAPPKTCVYLISFLMTFLVVTHWPTFYCCRSRYSHALLTLILFIIKVCGQDGCFYLTADADRASPLAFITVAPFSFPPQTHFLPFGFFDTSTRNYLKRPFSIVTLKLSLSSFGLYIHKDASGPVVMSARHRETNSCAINRTDTTWEKDNNFLIYFRTLNRSDKNRRRMLIVISLSHSYLTGERERNKWISFLDGCPNCFATLGVYLVTGAGGIERQNTGC